MKTAGCAEAGRTDRRFVPGDRPSLRRIVLFAVQLAFFVAAGVAGCGGDASDRASPGPERAGPVLLEGARVFVGNGRVIENGALLVSGGRIAAVGEAGDVPPPDGATRLDVSGRTVIPALIDAHAHLGYEGYTGWGADHYSRENVVDHLRRYAYYGFGAVLSAGTDPEDLALEIQRAQEEGEFAGARFLFAAGMAPPDQGPNDRFLVHTRAVSEALGVPVVRGLSSPEDARSAVAEVAAKGIPFVKIWVDDRGGSQEKLSPSIYRAVMAEARAQGLDVLVHQQSASDMPALIRAGADGFLHGRFGPDLDRTIAALLAEEDVWVVPNLGLSLLRNENPAGDPFFREAVSPAVAARLDSAASDRAGSPGARVTGAGRSGALDRLMDAGVTVVLGTDAGAVPDHFFGYAGHRELEILVDLGMTPAEALVAATGDAARVLGLEETGTLEAGKSADFVILRDDPLEEIRNTRTIEDVYLRGRRVDREGLRAAWRGATGSPSAARRPVPRIRRLVEAAEGGRGVRKPF